MSLNNLGTMLSDLGRRGRSSGGGKEAADIYRKLAENNPQAFLPDLATSLGVYGNALLGLERYDEAVRAFSEGLELLAPFFQKLPQAFAGWLVLEAATWKPAEGRQEPDGELLDG